MKGRNGANRYPDDVSAEVEAANRENREIDGTPELFGKLGHRKRNPIQVLRLFCLDCMGDQPSMVRKCTSIGCHLWPYRLGKNPFSARKGGF
jgi:hypothetical protein